LITFCSQKPKKLNQNLLITHHFHTLNTTQQGKISAKRHLRPERACMLVILVVNVYVVRDRLHLLCSFALLPQNLFPLAWVGVALFFF
jgi:hypothetical protein